MCDSLNQSVVSQNTQRRCVFVSSSGFTNKRCPGLTNVPPSFSISYTQVDKGWSSGFPLTRVLTSSTAHTILVSPHSYFSQSLMSYLQENFTISNLCMDSLARLSSRRVKWHRGTSGAIQFMPMVLSTIIMPPIIRWDMHVKWLATNLKNKEQALWKCLGKVTEDGLLRLRVSWCW